MNYREFAAETGLSSTMSRWLAGLISLQMARKNNIIFLCVIFYDV